MYRWGLVAGGLLVFLAVASQILVPSLGERKIEERLTEGGGSAEVTLGAFPAARLLFSDGERFEVSARDLDLELDRREQVFERLDGFSDRRCHGRRLDRGAIRARELRAAPRR